MKSKLSLILMLFIIIGTLIGFLLVSQVRGASFISEKLMVEETEMFAEGACSLRDPLSGSSEIYSAPPQFRPVDVNVQLNLETAVDKEGVERILAEVETRNPDWRTTVFVSPHFASHNPDFVRKIESRGHQIAVLGAVIEDKEERPLIRLSYTEQRSAIERAVLAVRAAVRYPDKVLDWKPQDLQWNSDTLRALQDLRLRSISGLFPCNETFKCQCPYALSVGKVTFPYPIQTGFWAIPISEVQRDSQSIILDDRFTSQTSSEDYLGYLVQKYEEQRKTGDPLIIAINGRDINENRLKVLGQFLEHIISVGGKVVPLSAFVTQSYITNFDVRAPSTPVSIGSQATLTVTYTSNLYCPKYRFRAYGRYVGENWKLIASNCFYVYTGDHLFTMQVAIPNPPTMTQEVYTYTVRVVGQASFGTCYADDPNWPTPDSYSVMKEVQINVLPRCIPLPNRTQGRHENRLDVVFVPDEDYGPPQSIEQWLPTFLNHINAQIDQRLGGQPPVTGMLDRFNFYYTRDQGDAEPNSNGPSSVLPANLLRDCPFADAVVVFHNEEFGDSSSVGERPNIYSSEGPIGRSFIHESGHGLFGLADEYDGPTHYFQPDPYPNIWATEQACRDYAANAGWNPNDCVKFTDRQGDWWKLGTTRFIMYDGSYFDNGWGAPSSRRIEWVLSQYTTTVQATASLTSPLASNATHLNLILNDSGFAVNQIARLKDSPPTQLPGTYDYTARFISFDGQMLGEFGFNDPRYIYAESGYTGPTYLSSATFSLNFPYYYNASNIQVYNRNGQLVRVIDISAIASGGISGTVTDSNGQAVGGAQIDIIGPDLSTTSTDANGRYLVRGLQPGSYILRVIPTADTNLLPTTVSLYVSRGQIITTNITLQLGTTIRGWVADALGRPIPDAILYMTGYETPRYRTDSNGYYLIRGLTPGNYTLNIDSLEDYYIYVNDRFVTFGTSVVLTTTAGEGLTVNFIKPALVHLPIILKNVEHIPYYWFDATDGGTIVAQGDDTYQYITLPFPFNFYGNTYTGLYVSSNGFVSFGSGYSHYSNSCIPSTSPPNNAIYAFWDDLVPTGGANGNIYVKQIDSGTFVIEWYRVKRYGSSDYETFEIVLHSDHSIVLQYQSVSNTDSATVGVENATGTLAKQYLCNGVGSPLRNQLAIRYTTP